MKPPFLLSLMPKRKREEYQEEIDRLLADRENINRQIQELIREKQELERAHFKMPLPRWSDEHLKFAAPGQPNIHDGRQDFSRARSRLESRMEFLWKQTRRIIKTIIVIEQERIDELDEEYDAIEAEWEKLPDGPEKAAAEDAMLDKQCDLNSEAAEAFERIQYKWNKIKDSGMEDDLFYLWLPFS